MNRIFFDCSASQPSGMMKINGGGEYSLKVLQKVLDKQSNDMELVVGISAQKEERKELVTMVQSAVNCGKRASIYRYHNLDALSDFLNKGKFTKVYFPVLYPSFSGLRLNPQIAVIGGILDLSSVAYNELGYQPGMLFEKGDGFDWLRVKKIQRCLDKKVKTKEDILQHKRLFELTDSIEIYTLSEYSKSSIEYHLDVKGRVRQVYWAPLKESPKLQENTEIILDKYLVVRKKFFLMNSVSRYTKNCFRMAMAFDELLERGQLEGEYKIVMLGATPEYQAYMNRRLKHPKSFVFDNYVDAEILEVMYKEAYALCYPSMVEGFGYPPVEAMRYNTLVLCSSAMSIPEICGDAAIYFNPFDETSMQIAILEALDDRYSNLLKEKIVARYKYITNRQEEDLNKLCDWIMGET